MTEVYKTSRCDLDIPRNVEIYKTSRCDLDIPRNVEIYKTLMFCLHDFYDYQSLLADYLVKRRPVDDIHVEIFIDEYDEKVFFDFVRIEIQKVIVEQQGKLTEEYGGKEYCLFRVCGVKTSGNSVHSIMSNELTEFFYTVLDHLNPGILLKRETPLFSNRSDIIFELKLLPELIKGIRELDFKTHRKGNNEEFSMMQTGVKSDRWYENRIGKNTILGEVNPFDLEDIEDAMTYLSSGTKMKACK